MRTLSHALLLAVFLGAVAAAAAAFAENVDPGGTDAQYAWGENVGWINAEPQGEGGSGVQVSGSAVTGWMWGENIGWINMSCTNRGTCGTTAYGVTNDGTGKLAGYAWGENVGWISFSCENTSACGASPYGVQIDGATGLWSGHAWGENIGWISFTNVPAAQRVTTDDGDGVAGSADNCDFDSNVSQTNTDAAPLPNPTPVVPDTTVPKSDAFGDACDADDDNDAVLDTDEPAGCNGSAALNPLGADSDGDRVRDGAECAMGSAPSNPASRPPIPSFANDTDHDTLSDVFEGTIGSNPNDPDSDDDGINDAIEYKGHSTSPTSVDSDGDGCYDDSEVASVNSDKLVNGIDLYVTSIGIGSPGNATVDANKDRSVNVADLYIVATNFTTIACP